MKNDILYENEKEITIPKLALKSYSQFWYSILIYIGIFIALLTFVKLEINSVSKEVFSFAGLFLGLIGFVFNFSGMRNSYKSKRIKEPFTSKVLVGRFGNMGLVLLWVFFIILYGYFIIFGFI